MLNIYEHATLVAVCALVSCETLRSRAVRDACTCQWWRCPGIVADSRAHSKSTAFTSWAAVDIWLLGALNVPILTIRVSFACFVAIAAASFLLIPISLTMLSQKWDCQWRIQKARFPTCERLKKKENCENPLFTVSRLWNHSFKTVMVQRQCVSGFKFKFSVIMHRHLAWHFLHSALPISLVLRLLLLRFYWSQYHSQCSHRSETANGESRRHGFPPVKD